jgi:hypothetical protein
MPRKPLLNFVLDASFRKEGKKRSLQIPDLKASLFNIRINQEKWILHPI